MSYSGEEQVKRDAVEALLESAVPRPMPPAEDERRVRDAVYAEWRDATGVRRSRQKMWRFAVAASVLVAAAVSFNAFRISDPAPVQVATIGKTHGPVHLLGENDEYRGLADAATAYAGQVIFTGEHAGIGLEWGRGGSLRIDQRTKVEFESETSVFLHSGRVYFDTRSATRAAELTINTSHGSLTHAGTQYMTESRDGVLLVSVREGKVEIDGHFYDHTATQGKQVKISGSARPTAVDLPAHATAWGWVEVMTPNIELDGMSTHEFLEWAARETGHEIVYTSTDAERIAKRGELNGTVDTDPRNALRIRMLGEDLAYEFDGGRIRVSTKHQ